MRGLDISEVAEAFDMDKETNPAVELSVQRIELSKSISMSKNFF